MKTGTRSSMRAVIALLHPHCQLEWKFSFVKKNLRVQVYDLVLRSLMEDTVKKITVHTKTL